MKLADRVAIVTGGGEGLGRAQALYLARRGARLIVNDVSSDSAARVADEISAPGGEAMPMPRRSPTRIQSERWSRPC